MTENRETPDADSDPVLEEIKRVHAGGGIDIGEWALKYRSKDQRYLEKVWCLLTGNGLSRHGSRGPAPKLTRYEVLRPIIEFYRRRTALPDAGACARRKISDKAFRDILEYAGKNPRRLTGYKYRRPSDLYKGIQKRIFDLGFEDQISNRTIQRKIKKLMPPDYVKKALSQ